MGIAATFTVLDSLPREEQVALAETALREPYPELQNAAFDVLADPVRLNEPERILQRYLELLPEVREKMAARKPVFANLAREFVRAPGDRTRRIGYEVLASLYQMDALPALVQGVRDPVPLVRERVGDLLENLALKYYYRMSAYRTYGDPENRRYLEEHRAVMLQALGDLMRSYADHRRRIFVDIVMETGGEAYPLVTDVILARPGSPVYDAFLHTLTVAQTEAAVELVFRLYQEGDPDVREAARRVMARRTDPSFASLVAGMLAKMIPDRIAALASRTTEVPWWPSVEAAGDLDPLACTRLIEFLSHSSVDPDLRNGLIRGFARRSHPDVRARVLATLQALDAPELLEAASRGLEDPSEDVRLQAARIVVAIDPPEKLKLLTPLLNSASEELRELAAREVSPVTFSRYVEAFDQLDPATRQLAARALAKIDGDLVKRLSDQINSLDPDRRLRALRMVRMFDAEENLHDVLMELLNDPDRRIRATTLRIVHLARNTEGLRLLVNCLQDPDARVRANAIEAFEDIGDPGYAPLLERFLNDSENRIRANAAKALLALGRPDARSVLEEMLADGDEARRVSAVWAISEARFGGAAEVLRHRSGIETSEKVRLKIEEALDRMARPE